MADKLYTTAIHFAFCQEQGTQYCHQRYTKLFPTIGTSQIHRYRLPGTADMTKIRVSMRCSYHGPILNHNGYRTGCKNDCITCRLDVYLLLDRFIPHFELFPSRKWTAIRQQILVLIMHPPRSKTTDDSCLTSAYRWGNREIYNLTIVASLGYYVIEPQTD